MWGVKGDNPWCYNHYWSEGQPVCLGVIAWWASGGSGSPVTWREGIPMCPQCRKEVRLEAALEVLCSGDG